MCSQSIKFQGSILCYINTSLNTIKHLKHCCFFCMKYAALGESLMTNIAFGFAPTHTSAHTHIDIYT